jgi:hypothetical protein
MYIVGSGQSDANNSHQPRGGGGGPIAASEGNATGHPAENFPQNAEREIDFAQKTGLGRPTLREMRQRHLVEGEDWWSEGRPKVVWLAESGRRKILELIAAPEAPAAALESPRNEDLPPAGHRYPDAEIPRLPQNGLILRRGRPGWWTADEAKVLQCRFANRRFILVDFEGRQVYCKVKDNSKFARGMVIPVRRDGNVVVSARQPREPGKW